MSRRYFKSAVIAAFALAIVAVVLVRRDTSVLTGDVGLAITASGSGMISLPYRRTDDTVGSASVQLDFNADGMFDDSERVIDQFPAVPRKYWNNNYFFRSERLTNSPIRVKVVFVGSQRQETVVRTVQPTVSRSAPRITDFQGVRSPLSSMKSGVPGTPDLMQSPAECAPTSAANAYISMANKHGEGGKLPADASHIISELKDEMRWTSTDGVVPDAFVAGSNLWAQKKRLSIQTKKVGQQNGAGTLDALSGALNDGSSAQLRLSFASVAKSGTHVWGGHLVTLTGVHSHNGKVFIDVQDSLSPSGTDTYLVQGNRIPDYTLRDRGVTTLSWGFTESWNEL